MVRSADGGGLGQRNELLPYRRETLPPSGGINQPNEPRRSFLPPYETKSRRQGELISHIRNRKGFFRLR